MVQQSRLKREKDLLNPAMPGMDCSVDGIANYVSCYGSATGNKEEADRRFIRLINELQAVLRVGSLERNRDRAGNRYDPKLHLRGSKFWRSH